jgi:hypothetical protein
MRCKAVEYAPPKAVLEILGDVFAVRKTDARAETAGIHAGALTLFGPFLGGGWVKIISGVKGGVDKCVSKEWPAKGGCC